MCGFSRAGDQRLSSNEIDALRSALERIGKAIDDEARKGQSEDWSLMVGYVQSCLEKLPGAIDKSQNVASQTYLKFQDWPI